ncbi:MAG: hypothetical protein KC613_21135, partial [Myxococcales bacterium]|nr:hypothetical protein [Myxococcales bacterium]
SATCTAFCEYLDGCGSCLYDETDTCLDVAGCAVLCDAQVPPAAAECVAGLAMCDDDAFSACYDDNIGDDDCANACRVLEACEQCFTDEDDECLSLAGCAVVCRDVTPPATAACIAAVGEACDTIDACFE